MYVYLFVFHCCVIICFLLTPQFKKVPTCHFISFYCFSVFFSYTNFNSSSKYDHCYYTEFCDNSSTSLLFTHFQSLVKFSKILCYFVTQSNFEITVVLHYFKFQCFGFRNSKTPFYLLSHNIIERPIVSRECF